MIDYSPIIVAKIKEVLAMAPTEILSYDFWIQFTNGVLNFLVGLGKCPGVIALYSWASCDFFCSCKILKCQNYDLFQKPTTVVSR